MPKHRQNLPQLSGQLFLTDGGIETSLIYRQGFHLPYFAAFNLLRTDAGRAGLRAYFEPYLAVARSQRVGIVLETPTWRANPDWADRLGYTPQELAAAWQTSIDMLAAMRDEYETPTTPVVISGCLGPRGDGYHPDYRMGEHEAAAYHAGAIRAFAASEADMVSAITMNYVEEAIGIAQAAGDAEMPVVISFTVETDGRLPTGQSLKDAILQVDEATNNGPAYYMINCAHPDHFAGILPAGEAWTDRIRGLRANASRKSHAELDAATEIDAGDPVALAGAYAMLRTRLGHLNVVGGCCGTDHRHIAEIGFACAAAPHDTTRAAA